MQKIKQKLFPKSNKKKQSQSSFVDDDIVIIPERQSQIFKQADETPDEKRKQELEEEEKDKVDLQGINEPEKEEQQQYKYSEYIVKDDDSLYGIAIKFNLHVEQIKAINDLSGEMLFPGQRIKLPSLVMRPSLKRFSIVPLQRQQSNRRQDLNIWNQDPQQVIQCISTENLIILKIKCIIALPTEILQENWQLLRMLFSSMPKITNNSHNSHNVMLFNSTALIVSVKKSKSHSVNKKNYNVCLSIEDVNEAVYQVLPNQFGQKDYILQILLSGIGKKSFEEKYRKQLVKWKYIKKSIATIFFRHADRDEDGFLIAEETKRDNCAIMAAFVTDSACDNIQKQINQKEATNILNVTSIPYIDLIKENLHVKKMEEDDGVNQEEVGSMISNRMDQLWGCIDYIPVLEEKTNCLTETQYKCLIESVPPVFRLAKWEIKYDIMNDGSSYMNMMNRIEYEAPIIVIIKDFDGNVFGAYIPIELQLNKSGFYGSGETYLFKCNVIGLDAMYHWSEKNENFLHSDSDGFGIGCGESFGLYVTKDLSQGYSNPCETFDSPRFSKDEIFKIQFLEIWGINLD